MAQGTRGRWLRVAATGLGMVLCTGLVGCLNSDKPKDTKIGAKQPSPGLPGTPMLGNTGGVAKTGQPTFGGPGSNLQPVGGIPAGAGQTRFGSNGLNTNTLGSTPPPNWAVQPGAGGIINPPAQPGPSVLPVGGVGMANPYLERTPSASAYSPPPPVLDQLPQPPAPPALGGPINGPEFGVPAANPYAPVAPPVPPVGSTGKGTPLSGGGFGSP